MYDHIGLHVKDLDASVRFYTAVLTGLGHVMSGRDDNGAGFGPPGSPALWLYLDKGAQGPGVHVAFRAGSRAAVERFHRDGLANGGRDNGGAGVREDYASNYYAAFLVDPDGNNVEAVCFT